MDSLKTVADKVKRSPQVIRRKLKTNPSKHHQELREDWLHQPEPLNDGVPFYVKYLGIRQVHKAQGTGCTDEAVKHIVEEAKRHKKSRDEAQLQKVLLTVSTKTIVVADMETKVVKLEVPIYRVSYCTADPNKPKVFAFILREQYTRDLYCHALLCSKESMARAISLTVADAFTVAYDSVKKPRPTKKQDIGDTNFASEQNSTPGTSPTASRTQPNSEPYDSHTGHLIDQSDVTSLTDPMTSSTNPFREGDSSSISSEHSSGNPFIQAEVRSSHELSGTSGRAPYIHVTDEACDRGIVNEGLDVTASQRMKALDLAVQDDFDAEFTRLAEARSSTNLFETPIRRTDFHDDVTSLLATEYTAKDIMKSRSTEDLFM